MESHEIPWNPMIHDVFHEIPWNSMKLRFMEFHGKFQGIP
jgi:hypothetical protein